MIRNQMMTGDAKRWRNLELDPNDPIPFAEYTRLLYKIRDKDGRTVPLVLNRHQRMVRRIKALTEEAGKPRRYLLTKFRQWGGTTGEVADGDHLTGTERGQYAATIAHDLDTTIKIFGIANRFYEYLGEPGVCSPSLLDAQGRPLFHWKRETGNRRELRYPEADSTYFVGTAGNTNFGHGLTINKAHLSEAARFNDLDATLAALEGVPYRGEIILESTPYGAQGRFYELNQAAYRGEGEWTLIFFVWYDDLQYQLPEIGDPPMSRDEEQQILQEVLRGSYAKFGNEEQALHQRMIAEGHVPLTAGQWKWRRWKRDSLKSRFFEQYPEDFISCWLMSGRPFFELSSFLHLGDSPPLNKLEGQSLWVYEAPIPGREYILWCDPAEGIERGSDVEEAHGATVETANTGKTDYTAWGIIDRETHEDVAVFLGRIDLVECARMLNKYGREYNVARCVVERNNHGHAILLSLSEVHGYPDIYHHGDRLLHDGTIERRPGFPTDQTTRATALDDLATALSTGAWAPRDPRMREQMKTFIVNAKGRPEAGPTHHDDLVLGRAIGEYVAAQPQTLGMSMVG